MATAIALSQRVRALSVPNPNVGCVIVKDGRVVGRGWTQAGGRPHAEAMALAQADAAAADATVYVSLEPCAHQSERGPACADALIAAGVTKVVVALTDPDPRTNGAGVARLRAAGVTVETGCLAVEARRAMAGWLISFQRGRPFVTLKLATSLDGCIALANGESQWITGEVARAHAHLERARSNAILVGRGTVAADQPRLDVRVPGLEGRQPLRVQLSTAQAAPGEGWVTLTSPQEITALTTCHYLLVEGGAGTASAFLREGVVDRLLLYRAPILIGGGKPCLADIGLTGLDAAHGAWQLVDTRMLGNNRLEIYEGAQCSQAS
ncbi:MAG: bifunctional diaminohydroxyphosphoribosylaminopyrimidine deaminase/5-amino-6-(5-phosphoribosylamino)uracil reductase RibD [Sphingomonadaceae bacterium]